MEMNPVTSGNVKAVGYDPASKTLRVEYKSGGVYEWDGVAPERHAELMAAKSIGSHLNKNLNQPHARKLT